MENKPFLFIFLFCMFLIPLVSSASLNIGNTTIKGVVIQLPPVIQTTITYPNTTIGDVNVTWLNENYVNIIGDNVTGDINMSNNSIWNVNILQVHNITGNSPIYVSNELIGLNITATNFIGEGSQITNISSLQINGGSCVPSNASGNFPGSVVTSGTNSSNNTANSLFQVLSDTRAGEVPQFMIQDGGPNQASLMVRSWIVANQNNTLLTSAQNNLCADWGFLNLDCNTASTGADFGVTDDIEALGLIHADRGFRAHTQDGGGLILGREHGQVWEGLNGTYSVATHTFCDTTANNFTDGDFWLELIEEATIREGLFARIDTFINSSCVELGANGLPDLTTGDTTFKVIDDPFFIFKKGFSQFYVGSNEEDTLEINIGNGTGSSGFYVDDEAGADQHQAVTISQLINNFAGVVGLNIFAGGGLKTTAVDYHLQTMTLDTSQINESGLTYIGALQLGENIENNIDFLHLSGDFNNIIKSGDNDVINAAYYDDALGATLNVTSNFTISGTANDMSIFENDNSIIYVGSEVNFTTVGVSLFSGSSGNIDALYYYCNNLGNWVTLPGVTDTTDGTKSSGTIHFVNPSDRGTCNNEIDLTAFGDTTNYAYIAVQRTKNNIVNDAVESIFTMSGGGELMILRKDYMRLNPIETAPETCSAITLGAIYFDISEDDMCVCKSTGWKEMTSGTACT